MTTRRLKGLRAAATSYGVSPSTIHKWISTGALDARHLKSGEWSIRRDPTAAVKARAASILRDVRAANRRMVAPVETKRERELGLPPRSETADRDTRSLAVVIFAPMGEGATFDARTPLNRVLAALVRSLGGTPVTGERGYQGEIRFPASVTEAQIASALARARLTKPMLAGGRLQLSLITDSGLLVPLSYAYANPRRAQTYAVGTLLRGGTMTGDTGRNKAALRQRSTERKRRKRASESYRARENEGRRARRKKYGK